MDNRSRVIVTDGGTGVTKLRSIKTFSFKNFVTNTSASTPVNLHSIATILNVCVEAVLEPIGSDFLSRSRAVILEELVPEVAPRCLVSLPM